MARTALTYIATEHEKDGAQVAHLGSAMASIPALRKALA